MGRKKHLSIIEAINSETAFKGFFKDIKTWRAWMTFFKALTGSQVRSKADLQLIRECTGLASPPLSPAREAFLICGRRSGKSTISALLAVFYSIWGGWEKYLSLGERCKVFVIATNMDQANVIIGKVKALLDLNSFMRAQVERMLKYSVELKSGIDIEIKPASWRTVRGFSVGLLIMEELAFFRFESESVLRDKEIYTAIKPGMTTIKNSLTIGISTPFARQGLLYEKHSQHWGKPGRVLIWQAPTWTMNLTLKEKDIEAEHLETLGPAEYGAEYQAKFREDIESYLPMQIIERAIVDGRTELLPESGLSYMAFCDPSEGLSKGGDSMTFSIGHVHEKKIIIDLLSEFRPPFDPAVVIEDLAHNCKLYGIHEITQDRHAIGWISKDLRPHNIDVMVAKKTKSELYGHFSVLMNKDLVELPDSKRLKNQLIGLQRTLKGGKSVKIDHYRSGKDDCSNAVAGVAVALAGESDEVGPDWAGTGASLGKKIEKEKADPKTAKGVPVEHPFLSMRENEERKQKGIVAAPGMHDNDEREQDDPDGAWVVGSSGGKRKKKGDSRLS